MGNVGMGHGGKCNSSCSVKDCQEVKNEVSSLADCAFQSIAEVRRDSLAIPQTSCAVSHGRLDESYEVGAALGKGAQGFVHMCKDRTTGVVRAAKLMDANKSSAKAAFQREVYFLNLTRESSVIRVIEVFMQPSYNAIILEKYEAHVKAMVKEHSLKHKRRQGILSDSSLQSVMRQAMRAVTYLHHCNVVHRDVKATNFLVDRMDPDDPDMRVVICDFGLARSLEPGKFLSCPVGTRRYWAPEMYDQSYWHAVDIFALGVMLFLISSLTYPFQTKEETQTRSVLPPSGLGTLATEMLTRLLAKRPKQRQPGHVLALHPWLSGNSHIAAERERQLPRRSLHQKSKPDVTGGPLEDEETSARLPHGWELSLHDGAATTSGEGWESDLILI